MSDKKPHKGDHCPKPDDETPDVTTFDTEPNTPDSGGGGTKNPPPPRQPGF